ncbi:lysosomal cholesterol signaling protein isoform X2 [Halyomorpha halys]|uniref:lysosomal cholesterol signaling protein isoform X2 n=1 Tax=Halyomorpha halys TaxID=286706 RepID=UPI0006D4FCD2|nr:integral membrane protein GPR155 isoform X1 [Halyomorpha halys]
MGEIFSSMDHNESPLENLYQALVESFGVIICGYIAGRLGVVTEQQSTGLSTFVGTFSLPSLIFLSLATLDLSSVCWLFLLSIFLAKAVVFVSVLLITLLVTRPIDPARAGLYAIFCTQSNDFALGFPIMLSVYGKNHPFLSYVWLLAPINLVMLNPLGFVMMELGQRKGEGTSTLKVATSVLTNIVTNPVVFMTALGIIGNLVFNHNLPTVLQSLLNVFGSAFTATALFLLGLRMVGNVRNFRGAALLVPALLISVKELILPLIIREISSSILHSSDYNSTLVTDMSTFGFLYGTFPAAPGVFVYATTYGLDLDLIAGAMVACTFISAPLMFISAKMISVSNMAPNDFIPALKNFELDISVAGVVAAVILLILFTLKKNYLKLPHKITMFILLCQLCSCGGVIMKSFKPVNGELAEFWMLRMGDFGAKIWTACLAITLALIEAKNFVSLVRMDIFFFFTAYGFPVFAILTISMVGGKMGMPNMEEEFPYGTVEATFTVLILLISLIVSMVYMILQQRYKRRYARYLVYSREASDAYDGAQTSTEIQGSRSDEIPLQTSFEDNTDDIQPIHHIALLFFLVGSIFITLSLCIWRIVMDDLTGVYVELAFLDIALTRGGSIFVLFIFGFDIVSFIQPLFRKIVESFKSGEPTTLPSLDEIPSETQHLCDQFTTYHMEPCRLQIVKRRRLKLWEFVQCFTGEDLVSWLLGEGLVKDREEGIVYGNHLLAGRLIRRLAGPIGLQFSDDAALFSFSD